MRDVENLTTYQTHHGVAIYNTSILWILKVDEPSIEMTPTEGIGKMDCWTDPEQGKPNVGSEGIEETVTLRTKAKRSL